MKKIIVATLVGLISVSSKASSPCLRPAISAKEVAVGTAVTAGFFYSVGRLMHSLVSPYEMQKRHMAHKPLKAALTMVEKLSEGEFISLYTYEMPFLGAQQHHSLESRKKSFARELIKYGTTGPKLRSMNKYFKEYLSSKCTYFDSFMGEQRSYEQLSEGNRIARVLRPVCKAASIILGGVSVISAFYALTR